jgi:hypothetical protein
VEHWRKIFVLGCVLAIPVVAQAAPPKGAVKLAAGRLFQTSDANGTYSCGNLPPWAPGRMVKSYFLPTKAEIKNTKVAIKAATSKKKKASLKATLSHLLGYLSFGNSACQTGPPPPGNFDALGNVTSTGKAAFGIPSWINANVNSGISAWNHPCFECHQVYPNTLTIKTFSGIRDRIQQSPMNFLVPGEVSDQTIADIVAFANY